MTPLETKKGPLTFRTWIACGFGLGFAPQAPGTVATAAVALLYGFTPVIDDILVTGFITAAICLLGIGLCGHAEDLLGRDAQSIVWDEFAGYAVAVWAIPKSWPVVIAAVFLFRFFDIVKIQPVRAAEKLPGCWGVMADDVMAGIYANLALRVLLRIFPGFGI
jgi:phosphatidylglycerophosphatase A